MTDLLTAAQAGGEAAFVVPVGDTPGGYSQWPDYATGPERVQSVFEPFPLSGRID